MSGFGGSGLKLGEPADLRGGAGVLKLAFDLTEGFFGACGGVLHGAIGDFAHAILVSAQCFIGVRSAGFEFAQHRSRAIELRTELLLNFLRQRGKQLTARGDQARFEAFDDGSCDGFGAPI